MRVITISILISALMFSYACGDATEEVTRVPATEEPKPKPPAEPDPSKPEGPELPNESAAKNKAIRAVQTSCGSCHFVGFQSPPLKTEAEILAKAARVCVRVGNNTMPPGGGLAAQVKSDILAGLCD